MSSDDGLCEHHTEHTTECGYIPAQGEIPCNMDCTDTDGDGVVNHVKSCSYTPATEGQPCGYVCKLCRSKTDAQEGQEPDTSTDNSLPETTETEETGENGLPETDSNAPEGEEDGETEDDAVANVQALIDALPTTEELSAMTSEEQQAAYAQVQAAQDAYAALTGEQQAQISGAENLDTLFAWFDSLTEPEVAGISSLSEHTIDTVSPAHVTFNLFDYWVNTQDSAYNVGWGEQKGINQGHSFIFGGVQGDGIWNFWTGNSNHYNAQNGNGPVWTVRRNCIKYSNGRVSYP